MKVTEAWDTMWRFAAERQATFMRRVSGLPPPWTTDPIIACHRFTNVYRASDRVSQRCIRIAYDGPQTAEEVVFRILLFKLFNRVDTWDTLAAKFPMTWRSFDVERYAKVLDGLDTVYGGAYLMSSPHHGHADRYRNHLQMIKDAVRSGLPAALEETKSLRESLHLMRSMKSVGNFLAYQLALDVNYSTVTNHDENEVVVVGPGALDGFNKVVASGTDPIRLIRWMVENADSEFRRLGLKFQDLWGRPLHLIDCEGLLCEISKYARVKHPELAGHLGRSRIKQKFRARDPKTPPPQWYPPKWGLRLPGAVIRRSNAKA